MKRNIGLLLIACLIIIVCMSLNTKYQTDTSLLTDVDTGIKRLVSHTEDIPFFT